MDLKKEKILFFGELPPRSIHGVPIANRLNLNLLQSVFDIHIIEEHIDLLEHGKFSINKYIAFIRYSYLVVKYSLSNRYKYFYSTFSLSFIGCFKTAVPLLLFKLLNPKTKIITHIHRGDFDDFYKRKLFHRMVSYAIFGAAHRIIFLSDKFINRNLPFSRKFTVLANSIEIPEYIQNISKEKHFLFLSNYIKEKGIGELIQAIVTSKNELIWLRSFGQFTSKEIKNQLLEINTSNIHINGIINNEFEKFNQIASALCLVLPSYNEGQPLVILEAMAAGTLVIATKVGDIENMLGMEYPLLIAPLSADELQLAMLKVLNMNNEERARLSDYLKKRFETLYSLETHKQRLFEIFIP